MILASNLRTAPAPSLVVAVFAPAFLGAWGLWERASLAVGFQLYLLGGCVLLPWLLLGIRPLAATGGLPFSPPAARRWRRLEWGMAVLLGPVFAAGYLLLRPLLGDPAAYLARLAALGVDLDRPLLTGAIFLALNPLVEEWWWRGQATPRCCAAFGRRRGLALVTIGFGGYHVLLLGCLFPWPLAVVRSLLIAAVGWAWSRLVLVQGGWRSALIAHVMADVTMVLMFALVVWPQR